MQQTQLSIFGGPDMNWGGDGFASYDGFMMAAAPVAPGTGSGAPPSGAPPASAPSGTGVPPAAGSPPAGTGAPPAGTGAPSGSPPGHPGGNDDNIAVLRQSHETIRRLGGEQAIQQATERYAKVQTTYKTLATELGYTPESFEEAFAADPNDVIQHLLEEKSRVPSGRGDGRGDGRDGRQPTVPDDLRRALDERLAPFEQVVRQQKATEANGRVEAEFDRLFAAHDLFKGKQVPAELKSGLFNYVADALKYEPDVLKSVLTSGNVQGVEKVFQNVISGAVQFINGWNKYMTGTSSTPPGTPPGTPGSPAAKTPPTLDQIINGDADADVLQSMRGFRGA